MTTVSANNLKISHKGSGGASIATLPDVCKTPSPGGPVPVSYPNTAYSRTLRKGTKTVKLDGGNTAAIKGSQYASSIGDEPGTAGGVKSSTFKKETDWITYSFDVKFEGKNVCRHTDKKFHNHKNTVDLAGDLEGIDLAVAQIVEDCVKAAEDAVNQQNFPNRSDPSPTSADCSRMVPDPNAPGERIQQRLLFGRQKHEHAEACIDANLQSAGLRDQVSIERPYQDGGGGNLISAGPEGSRPPYLSMVPDVVVHAPGQPTQVSSLLDMKFPCPANRDPQWGSREVFGQTYSQEAIYRTSFRRPPRLVSPRGIF